MSYSRRQLIIRNSQRSNAKELGTSESNNMPDSAKEMQEAQATAVHDIRHDPDFKPKGRADDLDEGELARLEGGDRP